MAKKKTKKATKKVKQVTKKAKKATRKVTKKLRKKVGTAKKTTKKVTKKKVGTAKKAAKKAVKKTAKKTAKATKKSARTTKKKASGVKKSASKLKAKITSQGRALKKKATKKSASAIDKARSSVNEAIDVAQKFVEEGVEKLRDSIPSLRQESEHPLVGSMAPRLTLKNQHGQDLAVDELVENHKKVVLYFYPKDDTPGCTTEACDFRDKMNHIQQDSALVIGVSPDSPDSHMMFIQKHSLNFDLLSDGAQELCETFNVWKQKNFMGRDYMGVERSTFLFHNGRVVKVWQPVKVNGHVDDVIEAIEALG